MKKSILYIAALALTTVTTLNSCIKEIDPQSSTVTKDQAANAPGAFNNFVSSLTSSLNGEFTYSGSSHYPWDFGYPSFFLQRDVMGQDIAVETSGSEWYTTWYSCGTGLGPTYAVCQLPWTYYYGWIKNCNTVLSLAGEDPANDQKAGAGIAYAMRAMFYMDLARMYAPETYAKNPEAATVPIITEQTSAADATNNPRATNKEIFALILSDLDKAETLLADYKRTDVYTPDVSVVYGLKARAYLTMEDWANAEKYAKQAQTGYQVMTESQYLSKTDGFNKPNASWMFGLTFRPSDPNITENDADSSWGSQMIIEVSGSGCGYSANYVGPKRIDSHLFSTIPATDFRRMCFLDPALDEMSKADAIKALEAYTGDPEGVYTTGTKVSSRGNLGCIEIKFRPKDGEYENQYTAFTVAVPLMRVEEMKLIEAEAAGMQNEARGIELLTAFAKTRDANYEYGTHNEAYYNTATSKFQNECWWQRRVELWGEGFATFDIKRLQKGIIRSYAGTNHVSGYQWNIQNTPNWMNLCIIQSETNNNSACTNNETPKPLSGDSDPFAW
ncbi:MAG: RagB/SusD family nutrient uptake outer membrane protein [Prevotella ruminicola]|jgi:hypothetical protein|uniref:RagB/SusD family nutrient uptake outer membrane protein n=1 Tax=Xylanibacter ruminicola TaxID=839 RepID=A0A9D5S810_XYLRU|nr:RagB/SusD family nutrient uptake outer membrane protein [Xylanibacter ruminicola]